MVDFRCDRISGNIYLRQVSCFQSNTKNLNFVYFISGSDDSNALGQCQEGDPTCSLHEVEELEESTIDESLAQAEELKLSEGVKVAKGIVVNFFLYLFINRCFDLIIYFEETFILIKLFMFS